LSGSPDTLFIQFGVSISYLIILGALMPRVVVSFTSTPPSFLLDRRLWITLSLTILVPLAFLRRLDSLRFTSYIALIAVADLVIVVVWKFFDRSGLAPPGEIELVNLSPALISALPVYVL
jgi:amino acid permease